MKINIVFPEFGLSGGVMVALRYARALTEFGHDVVCYAKKLPYTKPQSFKDIAHSVHRIISNYDAEIAVKRCGKFDYRIPLVINEKSIRNADIIIATAWCTAFDVYKLSEKKGKKYYFIQDYEIWDDEEKGIKSYTLPLKHIVIAKWIDDILVNEHCCPPGTIIYNGVDLSVFKPASVHVDNEITISMLYHLLPKKGVQEGLKVLEHIHCQYPGINISLFGKPDFPNKPDYIDYYQDPSQEMLVEIYQKSSIFLFPAKEEGWGLTAVEAMACGCAVVGTDTGCLSEIGINKYNALISEPEDIYQLENNLRTVIEDKQLRKKLAENALKTVKSLSWEDSYKKFEKELRKSCVDKGKQ